MVQAQPINRWEKRKRKTRQLIRETTYDLLLSDGYISLTIQTIADEADLSRGTFYLHFGSIEEVVWEFVDEALQETTQQALANFQELPYRQRKFQIWKRVFRFAHDHKSLLQAVLGDKGHPIFAKRVEKYFSEVIVYSIKQEGFAPNLPATVPIEFTGQFLAGALVRLMMWSLEKDFTPDELGQYFYEVLYHEPIPDNFRM